MDDLIFSTSSELAAAIRHRRVSTVEVLDAHLAQIARHNPTLNAIVTLNEGDARRRALAADEALARGELWGPLHGVPYTLKDVFDTAGLRSTMGFPDFAERIASEDHVIAARMKGAGGILLGKTNSALFPNNPFGDTNNPWDLERTPGGSSAGSVVAVATGMSPLDIGSDVGGSIIEPSHFTGVYGMRPTERRVPNGFLPTDSHRIWRNMMVMGPMARSVEDLHLALSILAGPDRTESIVPPVPWREMPHVAIHDLRMAWAVNFPGTPVAEDTQAAIETLAHTLDRQGVHIQQRQPDVDLVEQTRLVGRFYDIAVGSFATPSTALRDYLVVLDEREAFIARWEAFLADWDLFLCPADCATAPLHHQEPPVHPDSVVPSQFSPATGQPAVVIPLSMGRDGLPIGVQLIGRRWEDERLLAIAERVAHVTGGFRRPPGYSNLM